MSYRESVTWHGPEWYVVANGCCAEGGYSVGRDLTAESPHDFIVTTFYEADARRVADMLNGQEALLRAERERGRKLLAQRDRLETALESLQADGDRLAASLRVTSAVESAERELLLKGALELPDDRAYEAWQKSVADYLSNNPKKLVDKNIRAALKEAEP